MSSWRARRGPVSLKGRVSGGAPGDAGRASMSGATALPDKMAASYLRHAYERLMPSP